MISDNVVFEKSFDLDFQAALRLRLEQRVIWVAHRTTVRSLVSIKSTGLEPRTSALYKPKSVIARFGADPKVSCLAPCVGRQRWEHLQHHDGKQVYLFMTLASVPSPIGIDWTFPEVWNAVAEQSESDSSTPSEDLFARSIVKESVFVTYGVIPSRELLLVGPNSDMENPETFLRLSDVKDAELDELPC